MEKVKIALIGSGHFARNQHLPNLMRLDSVELAAVCDLSSETLNIIEKDFAPDCPLVTDYHVILNTPSVEAVIIATKEDSHVPLTLEALAAGKHVYVEKPLAENLETCKKVLAAQESTGKIVAVGMNRRLAPAYLKARELLNARGGIKNMFYRIADSYALWNKQIPGQRIFHELCHIFDCLRFFSDSEVANVYCVSSRPDDEQIILTFVSGTIAGIMSSGYTWYDFPKEHFEAIAERGALTVDDFTTLRQFDLSENEPPVIHFRGHSHPNYDSIHEELLQEMGLDALYALRRIIGRHGLIYCAHEQAGNTSSKAFLKEKEFFDRTLIANYLVNKGWLEALNDFAHAIREQRPFRGANVLDACRAAQITEAVFASRNTGKIVALKQEIY